MVIVYITLYIYICICIYIYREREREGERLSNLYTPNILEHIHIRNLLFPGGSFSWKNPKGFRQQETRQFRLVNIIVHRSSFTPVIRSCRKGQKQKKTNAETLPTFKYLGRGGLWLLRWWWEAIIVIFFCWHMFFLNTTYDVWQCPTSAFVDWPIFPRHSYMACTNRVNPFTRSLKHFPLGLLIENGQNKVFLDAFFGWQLSSTV